MTIVKKNKKNKKFKKRGGVHCALLRNPTLGCERVDKHTESCNPKYKKLFYDLSNLFIDNSNLSPDDITKLKDKLKKHMMGNKSCDKKHYNFSIILLNGNIVNIKINFYKNCRILLLIEYNANIHFTMFSDLNESKGYYGCCSPFHLTINRPKTRAYINFEYTENIDSLADAIEATGCYILNNKTRTTNEQISDTWSDILMNIDDYGGTSRDIFKEFCDNLKNYIIRKNPGYSDFDSVRFPDRHPRDREVAGYGYMSGLPPRRSPDGRTAARSRSPGPRYSDGRTAARSRSPGRRSSDGHTGLGRSGDRRYSDGSTGLGRSGDHRYFDGRTGHSRSGDRRRSGGNLLNKKIVDSINKYFDKIKKIKQEIKILKKKKNKKKIEAKKTTIKNTLLKIKLKKEKLKKQKLKQKQKK